MREVLKYKWIDHISLSERFQFDPDIDTVREGEPQQQTNGSWIDAVSDPIFKNQSVIIQKNKLLFFWKNKNQKNRAINQKNWSILPFLFEF
jgi:hypothetical protein